LTYMPSVPFLETGSYVMGYISPVRDWSFELFLRNADKDARA